MKMSRFAVYDDEDVKAFKTKIRAKRTQESTDFAINILNQYCESQSIAFVEHDLSPSTLNNLLSRFYLCIRNKKGEYYKINSMRNIRFSLQRYFLEFAKIDILGHDFAEANTVFENTLRLIKANGKGETNHHPEIEPEDLTKLFNMLNINNPTGLQEIVWFNTMFFFIRRGRENVRAMTKHSFAIGNDGKGEYIYQVEGELDKNHDINDKPFDTVGEGRIYANYSPKCPVMCFKKYISKLNPDIDCLWQRPKQNVSEHDIIWYCKVPHGEKHLGSMLSSMSLKYKLSQRYTNHSLRVTSVQALDDAKIEGRHIIRVSGHKSVRSVENYARKLSTSRKRTISSILSEKVENIQNQHQSESTSTSVCKGWLARTADSSNSSASSSSSANEVSDNVLANLPAELFTGSGVSFAPILHNCSNIHFHIHMHSEKYAVQQ